jgi:hypothetical protein
MNGTATLATKLGGGGDVPTGPVRQGMTGAVTALGIAVGSALLACTLLITRSQNRRAWRGPSRGGLGRDGGSYPESNHAHSWFAGEPSTIDSSGDPAGGGDSGSDGGGGGDGGGSD